MESVLVRASKEYEVIIGKGLLEKAGEYIKKVTKGKTAIIVSDDNVFSLYGEMLIKSLNDALIDTKTFVFENGEQSKSISVYSQLLNKMCEEHLCREDTVIALGGGVVGDLSGFAAATYQRGINFIQVPTSLLACVDSSVGGKTAVNLEKGKNQVGAFYQPSLVLCDTDTLKTLPKEQYINGCAEIIKYSMLCDGDTELFYDLLSTPICEQYESVIKRCVEKKRDFVEADEHDKGLRMMLNFGHTLGHAVETLSHYEIPHGNAVAIGMAIITKASCKNGFCTESDVELLTKLIKQYDLPCETSFSAKELSDVALTDKKIKGDTLNLVIPVGLGNCTLKEIDKDSLVDFI